jgi:hypothetical protein
MSATDPTMHPTLSKRIALDMDDVMADTLTAWLERYNQDFGTQITKADLHGKRIYDFVGPSHGPPELFPGKVRLAQKTFLHGASQCPGHRFSSGEPLVRRRRLF